MKRRLMWFLAVALLPGLAEADWPQFRGRGGSGVAIDAQLPTAWEEGKNIAWQVDLPGRGPSSPIVIGNRVVVTASDGVKQDQLLVLCFDAESGRELWRRQFWATGRTATHPSSANAAPTPASDGQRIFAFYSSNDLVCLDLDGNLQWYRGLAFDYPKAGNDIGMSSSPLVVDGTVVVQIENQGDSFAAGLDAATGETRWRIARDPRANWCSPSALPAADGGKMSVLLQSPSGLTAHDPASGKELWRFETGCSTVPSTVTQPGRVFLPSSEGIKLLEVGSESDAPELVWDASRLAPGTPSPVVHDGKVYCITSRGVLRCGRAADGKQLWELRLKGTFWGTPVVAEGKLYCVNRDGLAQVVRLGDSEGEVIASSEFGETIDCSPAVAGNAMYVRSDGHLWKISRSE